MSETVNKIAILSSAVKHALLADVQYYDFHASSAFNRKMKGIITPGIYGGFKPALAGGLNLKITSLQGPGGHGVASVDVNNHQITVQQIEDVTLAIPANGVTRVMLEANYQYGIKTSQVDDSSDIHAARIFTANISVPLADNHLEICRVTVPADATELTLDMIDSSHRQNKALGITLSSEIDSDADHIGASSHAVKKAVKAARDETEKQIEELVDNAPASLDTLKKIADAINNDPDFFNTLNAVLALKAPLHDPALTGIATVPTPPLSVSNKQIANTEFVQAAVAALVGSSPEALDTLAELAEALGNDPNFATTMLNKLAGKQPLDSTLTNLSGKDVAGLLQYLGLVEIVNQANNAVQKTGDRMTGPLTIREGNVTIETVSSDSPQYTIVNTATGAAVNIDLLDRVFRIFGSPWGGGPVKLFYFNLETGDVSIPGTFRAGGAALATDGNIYGTAWGDGAGNGGWLYSWVTNYINNTKSWINQNFVTGVKRGAQSSMTMDGGLVEAPSGCVLTGGNGNEGNQIGIALYRPLQVWRNGGWVTIGD